MKKEKEPQMSPLVRGDGKNAIDEERWYTDALNMASSSMLFIPSPHAKIYLSLCPQDLRCGYSSLITICRDELGLDMDGEKIIVVFVSRRRRLAKLVGSDLNNGNALYCRKLHKGIYQRVLASKEGLAIMPLTHAQLEDLLAGKDIVFERSDYLSG